MAKILGKDPFTYEKERDSFLTGLKQFHSSRGTSFIRQPSIGGKEVDLYLLFNRVEALGGYDKVNIPGLWDDLVEYFGIPKYCTHGGQAIKQFYQRYLYLYEKVNKGEDPEQRDEAEEPSAKRAKLKQLLTNVPTKYDHQQHIVADTVRRTLGLSTNFLKKEPYDKLEKALLSGLPNEVDFAINVCTLLSNEGKHSLNVPKNPRLIETLLAHVGIFRDGPGSLVTLHHEGWRPCTKRNFERFWLDSVPDKAVRELLSPRSLFEREKDEKSSVLGETSEYEKLRNEVLHIGRDLGVHDVEGQRILQVAMIIRNLSFEEENMGFLASNLLVFRFLMLCIHSQYWTLRQLGLDTLGNLALKMELDPLAYPTTQLVLGLVTKCISSPDRSDVVQGLEILARLCQVVNNWDLLSENLQQCVYDDIVNLLTVHDIQLIVFTLEALYHLTELGETPSNHVARIKAAIDTLVQMVTIEAQAYGPNSLLGIKVVEHVPAGSIGQQQPTHIPSHHVQRAGPPRPLHQQNRVPGTPPRPVGVPSTPRSNVSTPQGFRPTIGQTPPNRPGIGPMRTGTPGSPHRPQMVNASQRPGISPYQRPGLPAQQQIIGQQGMLRPQLPANYMQRPQANRQRNQTPTINQAECDAIAIAWLKAYYECVPGTIAIKNEVYAEYLATCSRYAIKNALNSTGFSDCIKMAFPHIQHQRVEREDGTLEMQLLGIIRRPTPHAFPPPPKRVVTGYVATPGGIRPMVYGSSNAAAMPPTNVQVPPTHRPIMATRQPLVGNNVATIRPQNVNPGTVVINVPGLPPTQNMQHLVATPPQTPPLSTTQTVTQVNQPASQNQTHQEVLTPNSTQDEAMDTEHSVDDVSCKQETNASAVSNAHGACLPVNRPPSRRRSCSGSSAHGSPPRSPIRPTRTKSPKSPRSKSPKSPRPLSPKGAQSRLSPRIEDINSDMSHAQMERIGDAVRVPLKETAIEKVENPCLRGLSDQSDHEKPNARQISTESRTSQNGNVKLNGGSNVNKICTSVDMVSPRTTDESHARTDAVHMNGDVLSPAPSDSSTATLDPTSPKRNGANPTTSPSILDKKAKIAQLLQDTKAAKEALGLGQNGIVAHMGNGDCTESKTSDTAVDDLPTAEGLTKQMAEATALMPETNGCDDNLLSESTDGINDHLMDDEDYSLAFSTDGTNDTPEGDAQGGNTGATKTVRASQQGTTNQAPTTATLEPTTGQTDVQSGVAGDQVNTQVVNTNSRNTSAQNSLGQSTTIENPTGSSFQTDKPGSVAIAELLQRKMHQGLSDSTQLGSQVHMVRPSGPSTTHIQSPLMQQLQQRLQRPNPNTQQQASLVYQTSQQPIGTETQLGTNDNIITQGVSVSGNVTTTHAAVQQQLLQRLKAPHLVQGQGQQQGHIQHRLQTPIGVNVSQVQQPLDPPSRPSSTGPPSRPPSAGPQVRPPSTGPAPLPSPSGSSDASTLPPASPGGTQPTRRPSTTSTTSNDSKAAANAKAKKRKGRSNSIESRRSSNTSVSGEVQYMCQWNECNTYFETTKAVCGHVAKEHATRLPLHGLCPWEEKCDGVRRGKWSLMTHVQDRHLTEAALKAAAVRRQQQPPAPPAASTATTAAKNASKPIGPAPVYPQDAALQAIRRFTPRPPYPELGEMKEGPVTKHIRLTSALILRNIAKYSSLGRSLLKRHESHLACMALSAVESSTALSHVLAELEHHALTSPAAKPESDGEGGESSGEESDMEDEATETTDLDVSMASQENVVH